MTINVSCVQKCIFTTGRVLWALGKWEALLWACGHGKPSSWCLFQVSKSVQWRACVLRAWARTDPVLGITGGPERQFRNNSCGLELRASVPAAPSSLRVLQPAGRVFQREGGNVEIGRHRLFFLRDEARKMPAICWQDVCQGNTWSPIEMSLFLTEYTC